MSALALEVVTTIALAIGLLVGNVLKPGAGIHAKHRRPPQWSARPDRTRRKWPSTANEAKGHSVAEFLLNVIPDNAVGAFARGDLLQILLFSVLFGTALTHLRIKSSVVATGVDKLTRLIFGVVALVMKVAPLGARGRWRSPSASSASPLYCGIDAAPSRPLPLPPPAGGGAL